MARGRQGGNAKNSIKIAVYGKHGTRKSNFLADFAKMKTEDGRPFRVLYIDCENGSIDGYALDRLIAEGIDVDNIYILYTSVYEEVEEMCERAIKNAPFYEIEEVSDETSGETEWIEAFGQEDKIIRDADGNTFVADAIVIDGITVLADEIKDSAINLSEKRAAIRAEIQNKTTEEKEVMVGTAGLEFKDHDKIKGRGKKLVYKLIKTTDKHVGISLRAKDEKIMKKDNQGNMVLTATGRETPESWGFILYDVYTVVHAMRDEEGNAYGIVEDKDRSGVFPDNCTIEELSVALWQPAIEKNKNRKANVATKAENYEKVFTKNEDTYKEIAGINDSTTQSPTKTDSEPSNLNEYINACVKLRSELPTPKKRGIKGSLEKEGLPVNWNSDSVTLEEMKKVYEFLKR